MLGLLSNHWSSMLREKILERGPMTPWTRDRISSVLALQFKAQSSFNHAPRWSRDVFPLRHQLLCLGLFPFPAQAQKQRARVSEPHDTH